MFIRSKRYLLIIALILFPANLYADDLANLISSTFRIDTKTGCGTCFIIKVNEKVHLMTARHVIKEASEYNKIYFYSKNMYSFKYELLKKDDDLDLAIITVDKTEFDKVGLKPIAIKLAEEDVNVGDKIYSAGCPNGTWTNCFVGEVTQVGHWTRMVPNILKGRSGSPVCKNGKLIGVVLMYSPEGGDGQSYCQTLANIRKFLNE